MSRSVSDAEPSVEKVRFAEHNCSSFTRSFHVTTVSAFVAHGGSSSSSAPPQVASIVEHVRLDDSDEHTGSKKLKLSERVNLPSGAPTSADANLSSDDMRVECLLERFERERVCEQVE